VTKDNSLLKITVGKTTFDSDSTKNLNTPEKIIDGRIMVPLRFVSEALNAHVDWDGDDQRVIISVKQDPNINYYIGKTVWINATKPDELFMDNLSEATISNVVLQPNTLDTETLQDAMVNGNLEFVEEPSNSDNSQYIITIQLPDKSIKQFEYYVYSFLDSRLQPDTITDALNSLFYLKNPYKAHSNWSSKIWDEVRQQKVSIGMTEDQATMSWGQPKDINNTTNSYSTHEQWVYGLSSYLYFDDGILTTIQN
jgi:hypothetical protein